MQIDKTKLSRRDLLRKSAAFGTLSVVGAGFLAAPNAAWAVEVSVIEPAQMATLLQMARDIYPHDQVDDKFYAIAVKGYDSEDSQALVASGVEEIDAKSNEIFGASYVDIKAEADRVAILQAVQEGDLFATMRAGLVTGLYNQKELWPIFGYEGESYSKGGYINRGFDDIDWL